MKIVHILYSGLGGHSSVTFSLVEADQRKTNQHILIFYGIEALPPGSIEKCNQLGIAYYFVKKEQGLDIGSYKVIIRTLKTVRPDVILLNSVNLILPVYYYRLFHKTKIISIEHEPNHLKGKKDWLWSFLLVPLSKNVVYLTGLYYEQMKQKLGLLFSQRKITVINNGINIGLFKPAIHATNEPVFRIGMLARLSGTKDHATLIKAFALLLQKNTTGKDLVLEIAGEGEKQEGLKALVTGLGIDNKVHFVGMIPERAAADFLNALDLYVHASLGETMSTSIMQAMACAKPMIASDIPGINNMIVPGQTALLVPALDEQQLAAAMKKLIADENLRKQLGAQALRYAQAHFSNTVMFEKYEQLF